MRTPLIFVHPEASLYDTSSALLHHHIHRGPVLDTDTNTVLHIITHARIIRYLVTNVCYSSFVRSIILSFLFSSSLQWHTDPRILDRTLGELGMGKYDNLEYAKETELVIDVLKRMHTRRISAVPLVNNDGVVTGLYSLSDIRYLPLNKLYAALQLPVNITLQKRCGLNVCNETVGYFVIGSGWRCKSNSFFPLSFSLSHLSSLSHSPTLSLTYFLPIGT